MQSKRCATCGRPFAWKKPSKRRTEILELIGQGKDNREIARLLKISRQAVKNNIRILFRDYGVHTRLSLYHFAILNGALPAPAPLTAEQAAALL
jgi:DNA-binding NarL/FixJ family response regulator